jgi:DnaJ family protein A protein 5
MLRCHYEVLGVPLDAEASTIKKAHRSLALRYHPDKNLDNSEEASEQFRLVQQAYECLSDPGERRYYDEHRDAILAGWSAGGNSNSNDASDFNFFVDLVHYMHPSCYQGFEEAGGGDDDDDDDHERKNSNSNNQGRPGFFAVYQELFRQLNEKEGDGALPDFGGPNAEWTEVSQFYAEWLGFSSELTFAWADVYDTSRDGGMDGEHRAVRRAVADANLRARKAARKARNDDVRALVRFVQRRDPRVRERTRQVEASKQKRLALQREQARVKKQQAQQAREEWRAQADQEQAAVEEEDRLAGRIRLADLDDDYEYGGGKKKKSKKRGKKLKGKIRAGDGFTRAEEKEGGDDESEGEAVAVDPPDALGAADDDREASDVEGPDTTANTMSKAEQNAGKSDGGDDDDDDDDKDGVESQSEASSSSSEPDVWRCECCRKDFKSRGQMENHFASKKHRQALKAYQTNVEDRQ